MRRPVRAAVRTLITAGVLALASTPAVVSAQTPTPLPIPVPGVSSVDVDSASIRYTAFTQGLYEAQWRVSGSSGWTAQSVSGGTFFLQDLEPETTYEIQMRVRPATGVLDLVGMVPHDAGDVYDVGVALPVPAHGDARIQSLRSRDLCLADGRHDLYRPLHTGRPRR